MNDNSCFKKYMDKDIPNQSITNNRKGGGDIHNNNKNDKNNNNRLS